MIYLLDLALLSWVFWPLEFLLFLLLYATVKPTSRDDAEDFRGPGIVILVLILAAVWYRCGWPTWTHLFEGIGLYIVAGFFLSLYKYWWVLHDFKRDAPAVLLHFTPTIHSPDACIKLCSNLSLPMGSVNYDVSRGIYIINWKEFPIAIWWIYWPCFVLSVVFDPLERVIRELMRWMRRFYAKLAEEFSVKAQ